MIRTIVTSLFLLAPIGAQAYEPVSDKGTFLTLLSGKSLSNRLYGVTLQVSPEGAISGKALGTEVVGNWIWEAGFFCREMAWGDRAIPYNCQLVEARGDEMRFTSDQGTGEAASFKLR